MILSLLFTIVRWEKAEVRPVHFRYISAAKVNSISVVGPFNDWDRTRSRLAVGADGKTWTTTLYIKPGVYQYLFCENGRRWFPDPSSTIVKNDSGDRMSDLVVEPEAFKFHRNRLGSGDVTFAALLHNPSRADCIRLSRKTAAVYFRTRHDDVQRVVLSVSRPNFEEHFNLRRVAQDRLYDRWRCEFPLNLRGATRYAFRIYDGTSSSLYGANGWAPSEVPWISYDFDRESLPDEPRWVKDAVFYQIFPDRFENGDFSNDPKNVAPWGTKPTANNRMGGDLKGIQKRLSYLKARGITALYLNPIFLSGSNHGYDTYDYMKIDPRFGSNSDLKALVRDAHRGGIRVILDGVFNHSGTGCFAFEDLVRKQKDSVYRDWYHVLHFPVVAREGQQTYRTFAGVWQMPKFNHTNRTTSKYLLQVATYWIKYANIDGWRLDVADQVPHDFWKAFRRAVKRVKPDAYIVGEEWGDPHEYIQGDEHDASMNYPWRHEVLNFFRTRLTPASEFEAKLSAIRETIPKDVTLSQFNLLGSHDTKRLIDELHGDPHALRQAIAFQFVYPGAPCVYYGDEVGISGGGDPDCRKCMIWDPRRWNRATLSTVDRLSRLRASSLALRRGTYMALLNKATPNVFGLERRYGSDRVVAYFNRGLVDFRIDQTDRVKAVLLDAAALDRHTLIVHPGGVAIVRT